jgi:hypothetical protein
MLKQKVFIFIAEIARYQKVFFKDSIEILYMKPG